LSLIFHALKEAIGALTGKKGAAGGEDIGRITRIAALTKLPQEAAAARSILKPLYKAYLQRVSNSVYVISFETACMLYGLCTVMRPATILDLGSGFTSAAFRTYAKTASHQCTVHSVDDDPQWLDRSLEFLAAEKLATDNVMLWPAFIASGGSYDLVLHDFGSNVATREQSLATAIERRATNGVLVLDDMQLEPYATHARNVCRTLGLHCVDLRELTLDSFGRYATLVTAA
jgi:predicted O-methyltransferase YrrM